MSIKAIQAVWDHSEQVGNRLLVLLAIADYAKDDGSGAWPDVDTLARKSRLSDTMTRIILKELVEVGEIIIHEGEGPRGTNLIDLHPRLMSGKTKGPQRKTRPKNGTGKGWKLPEGNPYLPEGNTGLEIRVSSEEIRVSNSGNTGLPIGNTGSPNPSLNRQSKPSKEPSGEAASAAPPPPPEPVQFEDIPPAPPQARRRATSEPTPQQALVAALAETTGMDPRLNGSRLGKVAAKLARVDATADLIRTHYGPGGWWYQRDWRGQKGEFPGPEQIIETWGQWTRPTPPNGNGHARAAPMTRHERNLRVLEEHERRSNGGGDAPPPPGTIDGRVIRYG